MTMGDSLCPFPPVSLDTDLEYQRTVVSINLYKFKNYAHLYYAEFCLLLSLSKVEAIDIVGHTSSANPLLRSISRRKLGHEQGKYRLSKGDLSRKDYYLSQFSNDSSPFLNSGTKQHNSANINISAVGDFLRDYGLDPDDKGLVSATIEGSKILAIEQIHGCAAGLCLTPKERSATYVKRVLPLVKKDGVSAQILNDAEPWCLTVIEKYDGLFDKHFCAITVSQTKLNTPANKLDQLGKRTRKNGLNLPASKRHQTGQNSMAVSSILDNRFKTMTAAYTTMNNTNWISVSQLATDPHSPETEATVQASTLHYPDTAAEAVTPSLDSTASSLNSAASSLVSDALFAPYCHPTTSSKATSFSSHHSTQIPSGSTNIFSTSYPVFGSTGYSNRAFDPIDPQTHYSNLNPTTCSLNSAFDPGVNFHQAVDPHYSHLNSTTCSLNSTFDPGVNFNQAFDPQAHFSRLNPTTCSWNRTLDSDVNSHQTINPQAYYSYLNHYKQAWFNALQPGADGTFNVNSNPGQSFFILDKGTDLNFTSPGVPNLYGQNPFICEGLHDLSGRVVSDQQILPTVRSKRGLLQDFGFSGISLGSRNGLGCLSLRPEDCTGFQSLAAPG